MSAPRRLVCAKTAILGAMSEKYIPPEKWAKRCASSQEGTEMSSAVFGAVYFILTCWLMKNKLNLE